MSSSVVRVCVLGAALMCVAPALSAQDECDDGSIEGVSDIVCEAYDGPNYPIQISWSNTDPDGAYSEHRIVRNGTVIATLVGGTDDAYTDNDGPGGQLVYEVVVYSEDSDCVANSDSCIVPVGVLWDCASDGPEFEAVDFDAGEDLEVVLEPCGFWMELITAVDGTTFNDLSPLEDGRADLDDVTVNVEFDAVDVDGIEWSLTSPEGTSLTLWSARDGDVEWTGAEVLFTDFGDPIPDETPADCSLPGCSFAPAGPGSFADFYAEDGNGEWVLEATASDEATLLDWCVGWFPDEYGEAGYVYIRGDVNGDGEVTALRDALYLLSHFFGDGDEPPCFRAADVDGSGSVSAVIDALRLLQHSFGDADPPPALYPDCGTEDPLYDYFPTSGEDSCADLPDCNPC